MDVIVYVGIGYAVGIVVVFSAIGFSELLEWNHSRRHEKALQALRNPAPARVVRRRP